MAIQEQVAARPPGVDVWMGSSGHEVVIQPSRGWSALRLHELWEYRDLLYFMTWRDLQARYRQMALGPLWIVIQPLLSMVLYTAIFGQIAKLPSDGKPYAIFTFAALLPWGVFTDAVNAASGSLISNRHLISKVYFPRLLPALSRFLSSLVDFSISFGILIVMLFAYDIQPNWGVVLIPFFLLVAGVLGLAVGFWFAGVIVYYHDFGQVVGIILRFWMYATPVVYSISLVPSLIPEKWLWLYRLNPMTGVVEGFRWALLGSSPPPDWIFGLSALACLPLMLGALYSFKRVERNIVDVA